MANIKIQPLTMWVKGETKTAEVLEVRSVGDDYHSSANNYYELREADVIDEEGKFISNGAICQNGNLDCSGQDYEDWDNSNEWIKAWVAQKLNLQIV